MEEGGKRAEQSEEEWERGGGGIPPLQGVNTGKEKLHKEIVCNFITLPVI